MSQCPYCAEQIRDAAINATTAEHPECGGSAAVWFGCGAAVVEDPT